MKSNISWSLTASEDVKITLGPAGSFWLQHGYGMHRGGLPEACESAIELDGHSKTRHITLGCGGAYVHLREDGFRWNLRGNYADLDKLLDDVELGSIEVRDSNMSQSNVVSGSAKANLNNTDSGA
tara:strand:- start:71 stop:445 length:375 start_codon:yes stop_codon:yes gene_type:complete